MKRMIRKVLPVIMSLTMVLSLLPTTAFAVTSDEVSTIADGTYTGFAKVSDVEGASEDMEDWEWQDYTVNVSVTVEDGAITEISTTGTAVPDESSSYWKRATVSTSSRTSVIDQIIEANSTEVDGVSNATYASGAIILAVDNALAGEVSTDTSDDTEEEADDLVYVQMNVPYDDFFAAYDVDDAAVWEVEEGLDAVSTATTSKFLGTTGLAAGTYNDGTYILGVVLSVAMDAETYAVLADFAVSSDELADAGSYAFTVLDETPEYYSTLTYADGTYSFSAIGDSELTTEYLSVGELSYDGGYGDYQVSVVGLSNASGVQISEESSDEDGNDTTEYQAVTVYTVIMNFEDADGSTCSYGTTALENLWFGTRVTYLEVAWSVPEGQQLRRAHNSGDLYYQFENINGATLDSVTLVTDQGVITVEAGLDLTAYAEGAEAEQTGAAEITVSGIPEDAENVEVTLSYTEGSGKSAVTTEVEASYDAQTGILTASEELTAGITYTVTITADNYLFGDIDIDADYFVLMNIPYEVFYAVIGAENIDGVDGISAATSSKYNYYNLAGGSYNCGDADIDGVTFCVRLTSEEYAALTELGYTAVDENTEAVEVVNQRQAYEISGIDTLFVQGDYAYAVISCQDTYLTADVAEDGVSITGIVTGDVTTVTVEYDFYTDTSYGDYQLDIEISDYVDGASEIAAATVNTTDGSIYALLHVEEIWTGGKLAWSTGHTTTVHNNVVNYELYEGMEGKTIESVTYYMTDGTVYEFVLASEAYVTPYTTDAEAELTSSTTIAVTGIPEDAENLSVSLSYTSGRSSVEVEASYDAETGVITAAEALLDDTTYTITITADNYAFESLSVEVSYVYVQMNVPYDDFFAAYGVDDAAVWEVEDGLDAVSTATTSKFLGTTGLAAGTYNDGTYILGVVLNVALLESTYEALAAYEVDADSLASAGSYYFTVLDEDPEYYSILDYADGSYSFAAIQDSSLTTEYLSVGELTLDSSYGDYQISIVGLTNASGVQISAESTDEDGNDTTEYQDVTVYTVIMNFEDADGNTYSYGTTALENLWFGTKVTYLEVAWSIEEGQGLTNHGGEALYQFAGINGATLTGVVLVTDQGVITVEADVDLPEYTSASATNRSDGTIEITGIPEDAENVAVTLSYTEGSGKSAVTTVVETTYENGILTITDADSVTEGTVYTISITSDNYAFADIEIEYGYEYVLMNIPYEVFYAALGTENVDGVDAISAATSSKYNYYNLAGGSYNSGDADIDGVTYAVKLSAADYEAFVALGYTLVTEDAQTVTVVNQRADYDISGIDTLFVQGDYAYADIDAQDSYLTASVADGVVSFTEFTGEATEVYVTYDFYTDTSYGDYQLDIDISDYVDGASEIAAATVNTTDGCTYALLHVEEIWTGGKLAWSTGHTTTVHNNVVNYELYEGMEGKTIESVTYYMTDGTIYTFILSESEETTDEEGNTTEELVASPAYVIPYYTGEIAAESASKTKIVLSGIDELEALTTITGVAVTYSVGSGKNSVTYTVEDAVYEDGVITGTFEAGVTYTVTIETEDYAQIEVEATVTEYDYTLYYECEETDEYDGYFGEIIDGEYVSGAVQIAANEDGTYTVVIVVDGTDSALSDIALIFDDVVYTSETDEAGYITYTLTLDDITETLDFSFTCTIASTGVTDTLALQIVFEGGTWSGHDIVYVGEAAADCVNTGVAAHYECSRCGAYFVISDDGTVAEADPADYVIAATGEHSYEVTESVSATDTEDGYIIYTCSVCGDTYTEVISATGTTKDDTDDDTSAGDDDDDSTGTGNDSDDTGDDGEDSTGTGDDADDTGDNDENGTDTGDTGTDSDSTGTDDDDTAAEVGDVSDMALWMGLAAFALMGLACIFAKKRRYN